MPRNTVRQLGATFRSVERAETQKRVTQQSPFGNIFARASFDWEEVDMATFVDGVAYSTSLGRSVTISATADGGAIKVSIWENNQKHEAYAGTCETLNAIFAALGPPTGDISQAAD
jgi:hypothetical protein